YNAYGISISGVGPNTGLQISYNVIRSNDVSLNLGDNDSWDGANVDFLMVGNTIEPSNNGVSRPYTSILVGSFNNSVGNVGLIDTVFANGAPATPTFAESLGYLGDNVEMGVLLNVTAAWAGGAPVAGATVQVFDASGTLVFTGATSS